MLVSLKWLVGRLLPEEYVFTIKESLKIYLYWFITERASLKRSIN